MRELELLIKVFQNKNYIDKEGLIKLLTCEDPKFIYVAADEVRSRVVGNDVHLRGLIEFSSYCFRTCFYCGLRRDNSKVKRYRMQPKEILECARRAVGYGLKTIVLQGGEDKTYSISELFGIVQDIKSMDVAVTLSIGELKRSEYAALKNAGADRYLLRIETSNENLYEELHPGMSYKNRVRCLYDLKELGYEAGTGCLIGIPGQTIEMLADDLLFFKKLDADMIGMGPFIPCEGTPLEKSVGGNVDLVYRMMSLTRLLLPEVNMPATTALGVKDDNGYKNGLKCGANVIMPNMGISEYKKMYAIYPGKGKGINNMENQIENIKKVVFELGRSIGLDYGSRRKTPML